jgi:hypothetical protein
VRRLITGLGLLLLVSAPPACLLYTDRINGPPMVAIVAPDALFPGKDAAFLGRFSDPDGDEVSLRWMRLDRDCGMTGAADWKEAAPVAMGQSYSMVPGRTAFCLRLVATDSGGAESVATYTGNPQNRPPELQLALVEPAAADHYPLYTAFRVAAKVRDDDDETPTVAWKIRTGAGKDVTPADCGGTAASDPGVSTACFAGEDPGPLLVTATATGGGGKTTTATVSLQVAEDQPPCIQAADPAVDTAAVVLAVTDPPRRFEVRQVDDDGDPFPPGPRGGTTFRWYTARETGPWTREIGYDRPTFDVSAARFEDARPGTIYRVRVEARDPAHDNPTALRELEACGDQRVCESPPHCVRWVGWKVQLQ